MEESKWTFTRPVAVGVGFSFGLGLDDRKGPEKIWGVYVLAFWQYERFMRG